MRSTGWRHAVDSSAPRAAAIWPTTLGSTSAGMLPADEIETLERLVDEVERMSGIGIGAVGLGGQEEIRERGRRGVAGDGGEHGALGRLAMAHGHPAPQPALERGKVRSGSPSGARSRRGAAPSQSAATRRAP